VKARGGRGSTDKGGIWVIQLSKCKPVEVGEAQGGIWVIQVSKCKPGEVGEAQTKGASGLSKYPSASKGR